MSNPEEVSAKRIRKALQELFSVDLNSHKHDLKELIISRFNRLQDLQSKTLKHEELVDLDSKLAVKLHDDEVAMLKRHRSGTKEKKPKKKKKRKVANDNPNSIHLKKVGLSPELQEFLKVEEMPRTQVVKSVWDYIKEHDLQNPEDRREIICDDAMKPIFGEKMTMFTLNKILSKHLFNLAKSEKDEITEQHSDLEP